MSEDKTLSKALSFINTEIRPVAGSFDINGEIPDSIIERVGRSGLLGSPFPREYGGMGMNPISYGRLIEGLSMACSSTRALLTVSTSLVGETILRCGTEEQKNKWLTKLATGECIAAFALTEPEVGSDASGIKMEYVATQTTFVLNGKKRWITFGALANLILVIAQNKGVTSAFLVETSRKGFSSKRINGMLANRGSYLAELSFTDVEVPAENLLGIIGSGFSYIANCALDFGRYNIAWAGLGIAQEALECMVSYSRKRRQFGKTIGSYQLIKELIADAVVEISSSRALCETAGNLRWTAHPDSPIYTSMAKYKTSKIANKVAADALQVHGANGCWNGFSIERLFREAKVLEIIEGSSQIQQELIGTYALGRYYRSDYTTN